MSQSTLSHLLENARFILLLILLLFFIQIISASNIALIQISEIQTSYINSVILNKAETLAFIATGNSLSIVDVADINNIFIVSFLPMQICKIVLNKDESLAFVTDYSNGLLIIN